MKRALESQRMLTENILLKDELSSKYGIPKIIGRVLQFLKLPKRFRRWLLQKQRFFCSERVAQGRSCLHGQSII